MLKEVYRTVPVPYFKRGEERKYHGYLLGVQYHPNQEPWMESLYWINGLHVSNDGTPNSPTSVYLWSTMNVNWWPSWDFGFYRFDGVSGKFIRRMVGQGSLGVIMAMQDVISSRMGTFYSVHLYGDIVYKGTLGNTATLPFGEDIEKEDSWGILAEGSDVSGVLGPAVGYPIQRFEPYNAAGDKLLGYGAGGAFAIDEGPNDTYLDGSFEDFRVFSWSTGKFKYATRMPGLITAMCLEDDNHVYILFGERRTVMLYDYVRGEVLGAVMIPSLQEAYGSNYWNNGDVRMGWDPYFKRLLVAEVTPDAPDGACTCVVRGFRTVPEATRITTPIPLKAPRQGRIVPVMTQVVGDLNEGVGGYVMKAEVYGSGSLVGMPVTDFNGNAFIQVACEGSPSFVASPPFDWEATGSPEALAPHTGLVEVFASATLYQPDQADIPVTGVTGATRGGVPGPPEGGGGGSFGPSEMPNMLHICQQVYNSKPWRLNEEFEDEPDGRGAWTGACVTAMHDVDARFGHFLKTGAQNNYEGHAVDAVCFKNDDGLSQEGADITGGANTPQWGAYERVARVPEGESQSWKYP